MKKLKLWGGLALLLIVIGGGLYLWWDSGPRWKPKTLTRNAAEISKLLEGAGWVTGGGNGPILYVVSFRSCPDCIRFKAEEAPGLRKAGVQIREIIVTRRDKNGLVRSTPAERSTVAELWLNRDWSLAERWRAVPIDAWTAPGLPAADGDAAREAVVEAGRQTVDDLRPLLKANGMEFFYPMLVWWTPDGRMKACACEKPQSFAYVRKDLGAT